MRSNNEASLTEQLQHVPLIPAGLPTARQNTSPFEPAWVYFHSRICLRGGRGYPFKGVFVRARADDNPSRSLHCVRPTDQRQAYPDAGPAFAQYMPTTRCEVGLRRSLVTCCARLANEQASARTEGGPPTRIFSEIVRPAVRLPGKAGFERNDATKATVSSG